MGSRGREGREGGRRGGDGPGRDRPRDRDGGLFEDRPGGGGRQEGHAEGGNERLDRLEERTTRLERQMARLRERLGETDDSTGAS